MSTINPEIIYDKPTHTHPEYGGVKVFIKTAALAGDHIVFIAEIMEGADKGKYTTVLAKDLQIYMDAKSLISALSPEDQKAFWDEIRKEKEEFDAREMAKEFRQWAHLKNS